MTSRMSESADEGQRGGDQSRATSPVIGAQGCGEDAGLRLAIASTREPHCLRGVNIFKSAWKCRVYQKFILLCFYLPMKSRQVKTRFDIYRNSVVRITS